MDPTGIAFNIQRFSTEDGPGIRTTVFLKGCPLQCEWCHNPEGISPWPELMWYDARCIGTRHCLCVCPTSALSLTPNGMEIDRTRCDACGDCSAACPTGALDVIGKAWTAKGLLAELRKDATFYETSGGGVTISGGEPMVQADFVAILSQLMHGAGIHLALDTCGTAAWERYQQVLPYVDLVLYDLKLFDGSRHRASTGADNHHILKNACRLADAGVPLWIRTPVIPGYTADATNIASIGNFIAAELPTVERWDLLAYTNLGQPKYHRLDRTYALESAPLLTKAEMEELYTVAIQRVPVASWSGVTRTVPS